MITSFLMSSPELLCNSWHPLRWQLMSEGTGVGLPFIKTEMTVGLCAAMYGLVTNSYSLYALWPFRPDVAIFIGVISYLPGKMDD